MVCRVCPVWVLSAALFVVASGVALAGCEESAKNEPTSAPVSSTAAADQPKARAHDASASAASLGVALDASTAAAAAPAKKADAKASAPRFDLATKCKERCLLLTEFSLSDLVGKKAGCKACENTPESCYEGVTWFEDDCSLVYGEASDDFLRNCVYAAHGYAFKKKKWRRIFGEKSWYSPRADFTESEFSAMETRNIRALRTRAKQCKKKGRGPVASKHKSAVFAFIKKAKAGKAKLPKRTFVEMEKFSAKKAKAMLRKFRWSPSATIEYVLYAPDGEKPKRGNRVLEVFEVDAGKDCDEDSSPGKESCEGDEYLIVELNKKNKVVAIGFRGTSACPYVYVDRSAGESAGEPLLAGEILRTLPSADAEATQHLRLGSSVSCEPVVNVRIAEEKLERTFLDFASLVVGDVVIAPTQCEASAAFCEDDGEYQVIDQGQSVELTFKIPEALRCQPTRLRANGYYLPLR